jgi:hypothetical protein
MEYIEFPITRERLQNIREEYENAERKKYINTVITYLSDIIIRSARSFAKRTLTITFRDIANNNRGKPINMYIDEIITKIKERFPDTTFKIDPARTYIYVDWS